MKRAALCPQIGSVSGYATYQALEPESLLYLSFQVEGDLMDGWIAQS
jgi:hypothetical protein